MSCAVRLQLDAAGNFDQRICQNRPCTRDSAREPNQTRYASRVSEEKRGERRDVSSLLLNIKQDAGWSWEWLGWRVCDDAERQQRNSMGGTGVRNRFCFHIDRGGSRFARYSLSLLAGIDQRGHRQHVDRLNRYV